MHYYWLNTCYYIIQKIKKIVSVCLTSTLIELTTALVACNAGDSFPSAQS